MPKWNDPGESTEELLTVHEVARRLRVDDTTVRRWIKAGAIEAVTLPHRGKREQYRIKKSTFERLINPPQPERQNTRTSSGTWLQNQPKP